VVRSCLLKAVPLMCCLVIVFGCFGKTVERNQCAIVRLDSGEIAIGCTSSYNPKNLYVECTELRTGHSRQDMDSLCTLITQKKKVHVLTRKELLSWLNIHGEAHTALLYSALSADEINISGDEVKINRDGSGTATGEAFVESYNIKQMAEDFSRS
jgi:hypothetical protein